MGQRGHAVHSGSNLMGRSRSLRLRKLGIVVLMAGLVSLAAFAKFNFALPSSSPSHWVSQTCKMHQSRPGAFEPAAIARAFIPVFRADQPRPRPTLIATRAIDQPPAAIPGFLRHAPLRAPPAV